MSTLVLKQLERVRSELSASKAPEQERAVVAQYVESLVHAVTTDSREPNTSLAVEVLGWAEAEGLGLLDVTADFVGGIAVYQWRPIPHPTRTRQLWLAWIDNVPRTPVEAGRIHPLLHLFVTGDPAESYKRLATLVESVAPGTDVVYDEVARILRYRRDEELVNFSRDET
jgi:hypothetical protein